MSTAGDFRSTWARRLDVDTLIRSCILAVALTQSALGQSGNATLTFANDHSSPLINGVSGNPVGLADSVKTALYWAPAGSSSFTQSGDAVVVGLPLDGLFAGRTVSAASPAGENLVFQVRAWGGGYATYEEARQHPGALLGQSPILQFPTGNPAAAPPLPPGFLGSFTGFTLTPNTNPVTSLSLTCAGDKTVECGSAWSFDPPQAADSCSTTVAISILDTGTNGQPAQAIKRTWLALDACGNSNTCSQTVTIISTRLPLLTCVTNKTVGCETNWDFDVPGAADACTGSPLPVTLLSTVTNAQCPYVITRTWSATDSAGNSNACSQTVTVLCSNCVVLQLAQACPAFPVPPGGVLAITGTVTNIGVFTLTNVLVLNDQPAPGTPLFGPAELDPGMGAAFVATYRVPGCGPFANTLSARATDQAGITYSNSLSSLCPGTNSAVTGDLNGDGIVDQDELNQVLANYWGHSAWLYMTNPTSLGGGVFQFALTNAGGWNFTVLASTNLVDWTNLPAMAYPVYQFVDPEAASNAPFRFYRLRWP